MKVEVRNLGNVGILLLCFGLPISLWVYFDYSIPKWLPDETKRGLYGDQFGGLNALFSGLAFGGVVFTLLLSYRQLKLQQKEMELQASRLTEGQQELARQTSALADKLQTFLPPVHRVSDAQADAEIAEKLLQTALDRIRDMAAYIGEHKVQASLEHLEASQEAWVRYSSEMIHFYAEASPLPDSSTSLLATGTSQRARFAHARAEELAEVARWLHNNYQEN